MIQVKLGKLGENMSVQVPAGSASSGQKEAPLSSALPSCLGCPRWNHAAKRIGFSCFEGRRQHWWWGPGDRLFIQGSRACLEGAIAGVRVRVNEADFSGFPVENGYQLEGASEGDGLVTRHLFVTGDNFPLETGVSGA